MEENIGPWCTRLCWYWNPCVDGFKSRNDHIFVGSECAPIADEEKLVEVDNLGGEIGGGGGGGA